MTTRQMMLLVAIVALILGGPQVIERLHQHFASRAAIPYLMAALCGNEFALFNERAATCRTLASKGIPWNQEGEDREVLRLCPHQLQEPEHGSWSEQAEGWEQAADMANRASARHWRRAGLYDLWGCWPMVAPVSLVVLIAVSWIYLGRLDRTCKRESTRRGGRIALLLVVMCLLPWVFHDVSCLPLFMSARE